MNIFEILLINFIFIILPITFWLLYRTYTKTLSIKKTTIFLDCALFSSFYLMIKYGIKLIPTTPIILFNIPLLLAYFKKRNYSIIILSICIIGYYYFNLNFNIWLLFLDVIIVYVIYLYVLKNDLDDNIFVDSFIMINLILLIIKVVVTPNLIEDTGYDNVSFIILMIFFCLMSKFVVYLFKKAEEILSIHLKYTELEHQKEITDSLFQITHEIKNPIAVCKGYLDMFDVDNIKHSKKYIPIIKDEINRLLLLLEDFLSINKIKINKELIDITLVLEDMLNSFAPIFRGRNIKINFSIDDEEIYIIADYNRLEQVLVNIIKNGMEAIPIDSNGMISLYLKRGLNCIKIYIEDNGEGISKENLEKLKSPFFSTKKRGTGLGVYLCNEIINAHGGNIRYFSKLGKGTRVVITLPYNKKDIKNFS